MVRMVLSSIRVIQNREFIKFTLPGNSWLLNFLNCKGLAPSALLCASFPEDPTANKDSGQESESIPEYTAEEEREDNRLWRTVVIGEQEQRIDMKVIEPYRRVISHGGSQAWCESGKWGMGSHVFFLLLESETRVFCSMTSQRPYWAINVQGTVKLSILPHTQFS